MAARAASALLQNNTPSKQGMERGEGGKRDVPWSGVDLLAQRGLEPNWLRTDDADGEDDAASVPCGFTLGEETDPCGSCTFG